MKITREAWDRYIKRLSALDEAAADEVLDWVVEHGYDNLRELIDYSYAVATKYGEGAGTLAAQMYDAIAELEGANLPAAQPAPTPDRDEVAKTVNGVLKRSKNEETLSSAVGNLVKRTGADTMLQNALRDGAEFAWIPRGDTCPFCLMLASNGWREASPKTIKYNHAEHIHANCDCTYAVRTDSRTQIEGYDPDKILEQFESMKEKSWEDRINAMRREDYAKRKDEINAQKRAAYAKRKMIEKGGDGGIIESKEISMERKKLQDAIEPMPKKQFQQIVKGFKRSGGEILTDEEAERYLDYKNADGATLNEKLIFLRKNPSRSAVFEELIHSAQFRNGEIEGTVRSMVQGEINAKEKLLKYKEQYGLTDKEVRDTEAMLAIYKEDLKRLDGGGNEI